MATSRPAAFRAAQDGISKLGLQTRYLDLQTITVRHAIVACLFQFGNVMSHGLNFAAGCIKPSSQAAELRVYPSKLLDLGPKTAILALDRFSFGGAPH